MIIMKKSAEVVKKKLNDGFDIDEYFENINVLIVEKLNNSNIVKEFTQKEMDQLVNSWYK